MATNIDLNGVDQGLWHPETLGVRAGNQMTEFGENSEALFLNSSFRFKSAAQAAARFGGTEPGNIYSRFTNPTVTMFQDKLAASVPLSICACKETKDKQRNKIVDNLLML